VEDNIYVCQSSSQSRFVTDASLNEFEVIGDVRRFLPLGMHWWFEAIEDSNVVSLLREQVSGVGTYESGTAGDQAVHGGIILPHRACR
jgi:hypothetical protein